MIRAKLVLRNVISKPLRSVIMILSLAAAAFAALFCISGINSAQNSLRDFFSSRYGDADIMIISRNGEFDVTEEELPAGSRLFRQDMTTISLTVPNEQYFNYVDKYSITVFGVDTKLGYEMKMYDAPYPTDNGVTVTAPLAAQLDKKVGDKLSFYGSGGVKYDLEILDIVAPTRSLSNSPVAMITTPELCNEISGLDKSAAGMMFADVPEERIAETLVKLPDDHPGLVAIGTTSNDSDESMASMLSIYYLIFAVVFLMVCFIVVSMSNHIVNERMSVIGMLRSIGGSIVGTGLLLMAESAFYGLCGGILGTLLFLPMRSATDIGIFAVAGGDYTRSDGINILTVLLVILSVVLIECFFSAFAIIRAAKTPVRDIIFGTKETAYIPSRIVSIIGAFLLYAGVAAFIFFDDFTMLIASAFCSVIGAVLLFPFILRLVSKGLAFLFGKLKMPVARLASKEISTTKSSVSSAQLILSAISLTISVFIIGMSMIDFFTHPVYNADVLITGPSQEQKFYTNVLNGIDEVEGVECLKSSNLSYEDRPLVCGEEMDIWLMALNDGGFRYFEGIKNCPGSLKDNEASIDRALAGKLSLGVGDKLTIELNRDKYLPTTLELKIKSLIDSGSYNNYKSTVLISDELYSSIYFDSVSDVLIKTAPGDGDRIAQILRNTLPDDDTAIMTIEEYTAQQQEYSASLLTIIYAVIALGFALSLMGTFSNMLMGFEQSRRKYAVFYSSSMSKNGLRKLIFLETALVSGVSAAASAIFGLYFLQIIIKALDMLNMSVEVSSPVLYALLFGAGTFVLLLTVSIRPLMQLSKMNIAEEIKTSAD